MSKQLTEIEIIKSENEMLKKALQDQVDYHHFIGNRECTITVTESFIYLYKKSMKRRINQI